jgi:CSLREA domain-containing protein
VGAKLSKGAWIAGVILGATLGLASPAQGATITVNTTADQAGSRPAECALREAIIAANRDEPFGGCRRGIGGDVVVLEAETYLLTRAGSGEDTSIRGDLDVTSQVEIRGAGQDRTTIDARDASDRHLDGRPGSSLELRDLTLDRGSLDEFNAGSISTQGILELDRVTVQRSVGPGGSGGIAGSSADITIKRSLIQRNRAEFAGGAIGTSGGSLTISRSQISQNRSNLFAGGVYPNSTDVAIRNSVIEGNRAPEQGGIALLAGTFEISGTRIVGNIAEEDAGGLYILVADGEISKSEVSGNVAGADGGGIQAVNGAEVSIVASTISGNEAGDNGGGIHVNSSSAELIFNGATVANNEADANANDVGSGGGIFVTAGAAIFYNSILGDNLLGGGSGGETECDGGIGAVYTLLENDCPGLGSNNVIADPRIRSLEDNGGPTLTHALRPNSPAIDAGDPSLPGTEASSCIPTDQRGLSRPTGECDMGAFELDGF